MGSEEAHLHLHTPGMLEAEGPPPAPPQSKLTSPPISVLGCQLAKYHKLGGLQQLHSILSVLEARNPKPVSQGRTAVGSAGALLPLPAPVAPGTPWLDQRTIRTYHRAASPPGPIPACWGPQESHAPGSLCPHL